MREKKTKDKKEKMPLGHVLSNDVKMLGKIWQMTPQYIFFMAVVGIVSGIASSLTTVCTFALFNALDEPDVTFGRIVGYLAAILAVNLAINLFHAWYYEYYQPITDKKLQHRMHAELFDHALSMDLACYDDPKFYNDYVWAMDESKRRAVQVLDDTSRLIKYLISLSTLVTLMMRVDVVVGLILLAGCAVSMVIWRISSILYLKKDERVKPDHRKNSYINRVYHLADYAKDLRIGRADENLQGMYAESVSHIVKEEVANGKRAFFLDLTDDVVTTVCRFLPMILLLMKLYRGEAQLGAFTASVSMIWELNWMMRDLIRNLIRLPENAQYAEKYLRFLSSVPTVTDGKEEAGPLETLEMKNVSFTYESVDPGKETDGEAERPAPSLDGVSLTIRKGEKIAVVGYNGAGKTTLTKLFMRLYDPTDGEILYNGKNLREYRIASLRDRIGTVFQDYKIFAATVAENVLGAECGEADRPLVEDALGKATFGEKLAELEKGTDTELTKEFYEDGVNLSGGEAQKVAVARIFARPVDLMIMDEPSSALDPMAEYELNHTILEYAKDKTVIFISHRLSTTRMADRIYMFDGGRLIESGSHDELMALPDGKYAAMFRLQAEKYRLHPEENAI